MVSKEDRLTVLGIISSFDFEQRIADGVAFSHRVCLSIT